MPFSALTSFFNHLWAEASTDNSVAIANALEKSKAANHLEFSRNQFAQFFDVSFLEHLIFVVHREIQTKSINYKFIKIADTTG